VPLDYRAGTFTIAAGANSGSAAFSSSLPNANYAAIVTIVGDPDITPGTTACVYPGVTNRTASSFQVTMVDCATGTAANGMPEAVTFSYLAIPNK